MNKSFTFKQFHIDIGQCGMPVSTDGVLLGAWADINKCQSILDIGCGTGLLSLMCAQREVSSVIDAVELMPIAVEVATKNIIHSPWSDRIKVFHQNILSYSSKKQYDAIICNPPYFTSGEQSQKGERSSARHTDSLPFSDLLTQCKKLLSPKGRASFILPLFEGTQFIEIAKTLDFRLTKLTNVKTTEKKDTSRLLIEISSFPYDYQENTLIIHNGNGYSDDFIKLTRCFYLNMD
ncbi:methyltransferase domain-containing protein [Aliivibrio finisterrensis]|uniref:tRNA1(Val) (adenine(37)-N6)-methyltransferase n=1 Tax=Aliivibrio finisterrensis TaxID=511998 RepID=UPI00101F8634|nr:methyltransferase [Aliivibrio finisterrensis]RYU69071.1 methyltransferase domain-containing protein [Aliivibrio finisterrensis]RYU72490.1 methyltransferase domain-containing protein [Aliivibrio finisterrensis]RYU75917.1 methyltransferase domain-containing protein [Aliivibrio finisterrensis]